MAKLKSGAQPFIEALRTGALVGDGGMGTQLYERGMLFSVNYEELNLSRPDVIRKVHQDFLHAGADVIETNTFGANSLRLARYGIEHRLREINLAAVKIATEAARARHTSPARSGRPGSFSRGSRSKRRACGPSRLAEALAEGGVDLLIIETMRHPQEILLALDAAREEWGRDLPIIAQVSIDQDLAMADGTTILAMGESLKAGGADAIGVNCSDGPQDVFAALEKLVSLGIPLSAMPNAGLPRRVDERLIYIATPEYFGLFARRMFKLGVRLVGGCCGTAPEHIRRIAAAARMAGSALEPEVNGPHTVEASYAPPAPAADIRVVPSAEKSRLAAKLAEKRFAVSVEVNPPTGLDIGKALSAAKMLIGAGIDVINIADGARAQARMSNVALAALMQEKLGIETIVHVCGRDRNLLGQVAHLLGADALGIGNLIVRETGGRVGDFPDATAVYDLDSIGILRLVAGLNRGLDPGGKPLGGATAFFCATGAEPAALNYEREMRRLRLKVVAGAELVMTQPVYDPVVLDRFLRDVEPLGVPVLVGLLPLASHRNAEFCTTRFRHAGAGGHSRADAQGRLRAPARKEGVTIAREMLASVRSRVAGAYIMPPLEKYDLALEVVDGFLDR
jgi:homocysteine S-methyltransferase